MTDDPIIHPSPDATDPRVAQLRAIASHIYSAIAASRSDDLAEEDTLDWLEDCEITIMLPNGLVFHADIMPAAEFLDAGEDDIPW